MKSPIQITLILILLAIISFIGSRPLFAQNPPDIPPNSPPFPGNLYRVDLNGNVAHLLAEGQYVLSNQGIGTTYIVGNNGKLIQTKTSYTQMTFDFQPTGNQYTPFAYFQRDGGFIYTFPNLQDSHSIRMIGQQADFHDIIIKPNSHILFSYNAEDEDASRWWLKAQEIDTYGKIIWEWNSEDHLKPTNSLQDWHHWNSSWWDSNTNRIIVSFRHEDAVLAINYPSGNIAWQFGGNPLGNHPMIKINSGTPFCKQHDAKILASNYLILFDNGCGDYSRAVEYQLDLQQFIANQMFEIRGPKAVAMGSYEILQNGNKLIGWGSATGEFSGFPAQTDILASEYSSAGLLLANVVKIDPVRDLTSVYRVRKFDVASHLPKLTKKTYMPLTVK